MRKKSFHTYTFDHGLRRYNKEPAFVNIGLLSCTYRLYSPGLHESEEPRKKDDDKTAQEEIILHHTNEDIRGNKVGREIRLCNQKQSNGYLVTINKLTKLNYPYSVQLYSDRERIAGTEASEEVMRPEVISDEVEDGDP